MFFNFHFYVEIASFPSLSLQKLCKNGMSFETTLIHLQDDLRDTVLQYEAILKGRFLTIKFKLPSLSQWFSLKPQFLAPSYFNMEPSYFNMEGCYRSSNIFTFVHLCIHQHPPHSRDPNSKVCYPSKPKELQCSYLNLRTITAICFCFVFFVFLFFFWCPNF